MPGLFEQFPHTNLHELNLDWIIDMINQFKKELEDSAVLSVNGETGHVTLYESENVILPALPSGVDQWRLVRLMGGQYVGILFYNGHAYIQRGNETMRLLTLEDIPTSSGVVSWNGLTGVVNVTGADISVDDTADADSIKQAIENEHTERVNADNALQNSITDINQATSTLNSKLTPQTMTISYSESVFRTHSISAIKHNRLLHIYGYFANSSNTNSGIVAVVNSCYPIGTVGSIGIPVQCDDDSVQYLSFESANNNLTIKTPTTLTANKYVRFDGFIECVQ